MADCVDLTSDGEGPAGRRAEATTSPACINLLSSGDEQTPAKQAHSNPPHPKALLAPKAELSSPLSGLGLGSQKAEDACNNNLSDALAINRSPALQRRLRPVRKLKKAYGNDFEMDFAATQSQPDADHDFQSPSPKRKKAGADPYAAALITPDSIRPAIPDEDEDYEDSPQPKRAKGKGRLTAEEKAAREAEKERKKQARLQAREAKKKAKEAAKAQKAQERLERQRETGKTAMRDITLHLDPDLAKHKTGREIMRQLEDTCGQAGVKGPGIELSRRLPMWPHRCATWTRAVYSRANADQSLTQSQSQSMSQLPASQSTDVEQQAVLYMLVCFTAEEFVKQLAADQLGSVIHEGSQKCPSHTLGILVEGLEHYLTQRQRREFQANGPGGGGFNRAFVDEFLGGMACRWPGVRHVVVHDSAQAAEHVAGLTRALAEQPFRIEAAYVSSFGAGKPDTQAMMELLRKAPLPHKEREIWFKALSYIPDLGPQIAHVVSTNFASMGALMAAYHRSQGNQKESMLQELVRFGGQRVGPTGSRKIFQILMSDDPNLCIQNTRKG